MKQKLDAKLIPYDITNQQARLLGYLDEQLKQGKDIVQKDLERTIKLRGSSITSLLQGLERKGFIIRNTGSRDGRTKQMRITEKGIALIDEVETAFQDVEALILKGLSDEEKKIYLKLLRITYDNFKTN
ncbi:MarR family transcriptional regulator [Desulfosporosinus sp. PR]|uniref:MarR family winged helix-turn-helix transcriptional regulator n=1 Tax=Candidatus Desulfosporosinus nitrosoreducens TaxID=3401928 RepID=UPI0027F13318|nr:MarR family transcriptional regulator [Desulfosporosinus sp. PR]MDQ7092331.1 MarR family transcriptional regulator [Desulfosporosinus sp. PR]